MSSNPIGIFDSGIGGLTIAHALKDRLPNESIIYYGDTKHLPYGEKSDDAIKHYSLRIAKFLEEKNCKIIIIACNSASAVAFNYIVQNIKSIPIFNVIDPVINSLSKKYEGKKIGVIGTKATIKSKIYQEKIKRKLFPFYKNKHLQFVFNKLQEGYSGDTCLLYTSPSPRD